MTLPNTCMLNFEFTKNLVFTNFIWACMPDACGMYRIFDKLAMDFERVPKLFFENDLF